jgi:hypothetical protein
MPNRDAHAPREPHAPSRASVPDPAQENRRSLLKAAAFFAGSGAFLFLLKFLLDF